MHVAEPLIVPATRRPEAVAVEHVTKTFPKSHDFLTWLRHRGQPPRFRAVTDVSFTVAAGELFGLLGENGAGKSTILQMLSGLTTPDTGTVRVDGVDGNAGDTHSRDLRARIGLCSAEERSFYYRLSARQNLRFFGTLDGLHGKALDNRIDIVARHVDLLPKLDRNFETYSSGMKQRLAIARALLADPPVLLLDEPTRAVDPVHARDIRALIRSLVVNEGKTAVLCTNLLEEAWELCDRIAVIAAGKIITIANPNDLIAQSRSRRYSVLLDSMDAGLVDRTRAVAGLSRVVVEQEANGVRLIADLDESPRTLTDLLRAVSANGVAVQHIAPENASPFEIYSRLAAGERT
jgi:ABC-2 type transport system ATP-binding protein